MAKQSRYYIYRNLRLKNTFSVRLDGKVVSRVTLALARNVTFQVSEAGRERVLREKQKNVHAYVVARDITEYSEPVGTSMPQRITYNPYMAPHFMVNGEPIHRAHAVIFEDGCCWLVK